MKVCSFPSGLLLVASAILGSRGAIEHSDPSFSTQSLY
jgi:hypothetical protein